MLFDFFLSLHVSSVKLKLFSHCFSTPIVLHNFHKISTEQAKRKMLLPFIGHKIYKSNKLEDKLTK